MSPTMSGVHLIRARASRTALRHTSAPTPAGSPMLIATMGRFLIAFALRRLVLFAGGPRAR